MARKYRPTGRPPGRPPAQTKFDPDKFEAMVQAVTQLAVEATGNNETGALEPQAVANFNLNRKLVALTREELEKSAEEARSNIALVVKEFHHRIPALLERLAKTDPDKALKFYVEMLEYQTPKLNRTESVGKVQVQHFVHVENREDRPEPIDVTPSGVEK